MKKINKWFSKFLVGIVAVAQLVSANPPQITYAAQENVESQTTNGNEKTSNEIRYVALGDSITAGNDSYVNMVSKNLEKKYGNCKTDNLAVSGWTSQDLLDALTNSSNSNYKRMRSAVSNADIITLDIGSNDILIPVINIIADSFGCSLDQLGNVTAAWSKKVQNASGISAYFVYLDAMRIAVNINRRLYYGQEMPAAVEKFDSNYAGILKVISEIAPNAEVYLGNLYNPYVGAASVYLGSFTIVNVESFTDEYMRKVNKVINANAGGKVVVDLYNTINNPCYIKGDVANYDYDPHPNQAGQQAIANKFIAAINNNTRK